MGDTHHVVPVLALRAIYSVALRALMAERSTVQGAARIGGTTLFQREGKGKGSYLPFKDLPEASCTRLDSHYLRGIVPFPRAGNIFTQ